MTLRPIELLLVEDSPGDIRLTRESLLEGKVCNTLHVVQDGVEALRFLRREGRFANAVTPDLILLDLHLPKKNGQEVLAEIRADHDLQGIPIAILTASPADQDILRCLGLPSSCYLTKPVDLRQFIGVVQSIEHFGITVTAMNRSWVKQHLAESA